MKMIKIVSITMLICMLSVMTVLAKTTQAVGTTSTPQIYTYMPNESEKGFDFNYTFEDKDGCLRRFTYLESAEIVYKNIYGAETNLIDATINREGVFEYTSNQQADIGFGFKYAFVDKDGYLRKFANLEYAELGHDKMFKISLDAQ